MLWSTALRISLGVVWFSVSVHGGCKSRVYIQQYYGELDCTPVHSSDSACPSRYDCSSTFPRKADKCYYMGNEYDLNTTLTHPAFGQPCVGECRCKRYGKSSKLQCLFGECPEDMFDGDIEEDCHYQYSHDHCCSVNTYCPERKGDIGQETTCVSNDQEYREGERFYPTEEPCKKCICAEGFNGTLTEPWCRDIRCELDLQYSEQIASGCIPIYYGDKSCCPIDWRCPKRSDKVVRRKKPTAASLRQNAVETTTCQFGKLKLRVGDFLSAERRRKNTICKCLVPPHATCLVTRENDNR